MVGFQDKGALKTFIVASMFVGFTIIAMDDLNENEKTQLNNAVKYGSVKYLKNLLEIKNIDPSDFCQAQCISPPEVSQKLYAMLNFFLDNNACDRFSEHEKNILKAWGILVEE